MIISGIAVATLMGDNGIIKRAGDAKETQRGAAVQDEVTLAIAENAMIDQLNSVNGGNENKKKRADVVADLVKKEYLNKDEAKLLETEDTITIGSITIDFSKLPTTSEVIWTYNHSTQTVTNGTLTLKIGDRVNDTATQTIEGFDGKWRVLGAENGKLLLVTNTCYAPFEGADTSMGASYPALKLEGLAGWNNGVANLKAVGEAYANSSSKFEDGRSIKIEDIDRITGYNPENTGKNDPNKTGTGTIYGEGNSNQYGNKVTYIISGKVNWSTNYDENNPSAATWNPTRTTTFKPLGVDTPLAEGETYTVNKSDHYLYYATTLTENSSDSTTDGLDANSAAYDMLFNVQGPPYWLASPCVNASDSVFWGFRIVGNGGVGSHNVWDSIGGSYGYSFGVRPVVSLKSDIQLTPGETDDKGITTYTI